MQDTCLLIVDLFYYGGLCLEECWHDNLQEKDAIYIFEKKRQVLFSGGSGKFSLRGACFCVVLFLLNLR